MKYTATQIENAKRNYTSFVNYKTLSDYDVSTIGHVEAQTRVDFHNNIVREITNGNKAVIAEWKKFFLMEEVRADQKARKSAEKKTANKNASASILAPIKELKKLGAFGKWLNTSGNPFRKEHFNKKYTIESVNTFLAL